MERLRYDVIVVGSGAGGSAAAYRLARAGRRVLLLEAGPALPEDGSTLDVRKVLHEGVFKSAEVWLDGSGAEFAPEEFSNVGGKTRWYGAALLRFGDDEFAADPLKRFRAWPVAPGELAPYYEEAEQLLGLHRFPTEPDLARIARRLNGAGAGWRASPLALGVSAAIVDKPELATRFDGFALPEGYKADAHSRMLRDGVRPPLLTLRTNARVMKLVGAPDEPRRLIGVVTADDRRHYGDVIVLAAGALHSPRLLQKYFHSTGLAQRLPAAGNVGRYYKRHVLTAVIAFGLRPQHDRLRKTALFTHPSYPHSSAQPLGGWVDREIVRAMFPRFVPRFVREFFARRAYGFFLQTEDGSHPDNRVECANGRGRPVLDYRLDRLPEARREHAELVRAFLWGLLKAGFLPFAQRIGLAGSAHSVGTLAAGDDARTSVVDGSGRVHGMTNLYVADGSVLPRIGRFNPALTIYAWGLRLADRLAKTPQYKEITHGAELRS